MTRQALPYIAFTSFLFGSTLVASRFSVGQFHPLQYISFRLMLAGAGHLLIYAATQRPFPRDKRLWFHAAMFGVFGTAVNLVSIVSALQYISSGLTSVLITSTPAVTALLAHFFLPEERLRLSQWTGVIVALSGAIMLTFAGESGLPDVTTANPLGYVLVAIAIISGSTMTIYARQTLQKYDSFDTASIRMWVAGLAVIPLTTLGIGFDVGSVTTPAVGAVLYAAVIGTFGGFFLQLYTIQRFGAIAAAMVPYLIPLVATVGGLLVLGETITPLMVAGIIIILTGIALVQRPRAETEMNTGD